MKVIRSLGNPLIVVGMLLIGVFSIAMLHSLVLSRLSIAKFNGDRTKRIQGPSTPAAPRFELWSVKRLNAYRESLTTPIGAPLAVLRVPRLNIEAPVLEGTDEFALNRGIGWIVGTARPGEQGNIGIAGHRDGFFRPLKDIRIGDRIEVSTIDRTEIYEVDELEIVTPENGAVLRQRKRQAITLVTCYPFYFVGDAPRRFIVHGSIDTTRKPGEEKRELARQ